VLQFAISIRVDPYQRSLGPIFVDGSHVAFNAEADETFEPNTIPPATKALRSKPIWIPVICRSTQNVEPRAPVFETLTEPEPGDEVDLSLVAANTGSAKQTNMQKIATRRKTNR
jgi:hypothetical protein